MGVAAGFVVFAIGAIMRFAVPASAKGVDFHGIGELLMIVGDIVFLGSLVFWRSWDGFGGSARKRRTTVSGVGGMTTAKSKEHAV